MAYPTTDTSSPMPSSLMIKHNQKDAQATLSLKASIFLQGFAGAQPFMLQYDADNFVPGTVSLGPATIDLPPARLIQIARSGSPQIRTLSLSLKACCPIWCPPTRSIAPKQGYDAVFQQLAALAEATKLCIVLDYQYLGDEHVALIQKLIELPDQLSGVPLRYRADQFRLTNASIFKAYEHVHAEVETDATTEDEQPPAYAEASSKRPRHTSTSSASSSPIRKRTVLSPPEHWPSSPTEKDSIAALCPQSPYSHTTLTPNTRQAVHDVVSECVQSVLETVLPALLAAPLSPSPLPPSQSSKPSPQLALTTLGTILGDHIKRSLERKLESICADALSDASYIRDVADTEFLEEIADRRLELLMAKDDCVTELDCVTAEKLDEFREECEVDLEEVGDRIDIKANDAYDSVSERIDAYVNAKMDHLKRETGWLGWEREVFERDKRKFEVAKQDGHVRRGVRARSVPP
ncbi:hypothetical protein ACEQ8H_008987 [Pleosporales sp. CAS-2024a]